MCGLLLPSSETRISSLPPGCPAKKKTNRTLARFTCNSRFTCEGRKNIVTSFGPIISDDISGLKTWAQIWGICSGHFEEAGIFWCSVVFIGLLWGRRCPRQVPKIFPLKGSQNKKPRNFTPLGCQVTPHLFATHSWLGFAGNDAWKK